MAENFDGRNVLRIDGRRVKTGTPDEQPARFFVNGTVHPATPGQVQTLVDRTVNAVNNGTNPPVPYSLRNAQALLRQVIMQRNGGLEGLIQTIDDAQVATDRYNNPDHVVRLKAVDMKFRLMGVLGPEAAAAREEASQENTQRVILPADGATLGGKDAATAFLTRVRAAQTGEDPNEIKLDVSEEDMLRLSPASIGLDFGTEELAVHTRDGSKLEESEGVENDD